MDIIIRRAKAEDALFLTSISFGAKRYWNCSGEYLSGSDEDLTITEEYLNENIVFVTQKKDTIIGYCSLHEIKEDYMIKEDVIEAGYWLEHIFIRPAYIQNGIGRKLIDQVKEYCKENEIATFSAISHPITNGFYDKMGAQYIKDMGTGEVGQEVCLFRFNILDTPIIENTDETLEDIEGMDINPIADVEEETQNDEMTMETESITVGEMEEDSLSELEDTIGMVTEAVEQETLSYKLFELDKDLDEDDLCDMKDEDGVYGFKIDNDDGYFFNDELDVEEENMNLEGSEDMEDTEEFVSKLSYEEFLNSIVPIGYKFECEEEAELLAQQEEKVEESIEKRDEEPQQTSVETLSIQELEVLLGSMGSSEEQQFDDEEIEEGQETAGSAASEELEEVEDNEEIEIGQEVQEFIIDEEAEAIEETEEDQEIAESIANEEYEDIETSEETEGEDEVETQSEEVEKQEDREMEYEALMQQIIEEEHVADTVALYAVEDDSNSQAKQMEEHTNEKLIDNIKTEKAKMLSGEMYIAWGDEIVEDRKQARKLLKEFNNTDPEDKRLTHMILTKLFRRVGEYIHIEPTFKCNYGYNIEVGDNFYAGYNLVIVDNARVKIGNNCIISPQVGIYTLAYPLNVEKRIAGYEYAESVTIGDNVWIGGGTTINPGVTIGNNVVISPGAVIVSDIPDGVLVGGNPAKIIRYMTE